MNNFVSFSAIRSSLTFCNLIYGKLESEAVMINIFIYSAIFWLFSVERDETGMEKIRNELPKSMR